MFEYAFMQRALLSGIVISIVIPCVGLILVLKRYAMLGDALSHSALAGVCAGLIIGWNPTFGATIACIIAAIVVSYIAKKIRYNKEIAIALIMSLGIGISGILTGFISSNVNINSFLFGSIVAVSSFEFYTILMLATCVLLLFVKYYYALMFYAYSEEEGKQVGLRMQYIDLLFTVMIGVTISISARIVGALIISSMLVIPAACGMILGKSFFSTLMFGIVISLCTMLTGLTLSYYVGLKPGGTIVVLSCLLYIGLLLFHRKQG